MKTIFQFFCINSALFILFCLNIFTNPLYSQWVKTSGPGGGHINTFVTVGTKIFVGTGNEVNSTHGTVFLSTDDGASWSEASNGLPANASILSLAVSGTTIFAGTNGFQEGGVSKGGVFRSTDNGTSWTSVNSGLTNAITPYLTISGLVVIGTNIFAGTNSAGVFLSTDNGTNWVPVNNGMPQLLSGGFLVGPIINHIAVSDTNLIVQLGDITGFGSGGVYRSSNNGTSWDKVADAGSNPISCFATSGTNLYAAANTLYLSTNNGSSWTQVNPDFYLKSLFISGTDFFATWPGAGVFRSTDNGTNWTSINAGLSTGSGTQLSITSFGMSGSNLFVGKYSGGVFHSTNKGTTWIPANVGLTNMDVTSLAVKGTNLFAGTTYDGVFRSTDTGASWNLVEATYNGGAYVNTLAVCETTIFAGTADGPYYSTDNGTNWAGGGWNRNVFAYSVSGKNIYAAFAGLGIFSSTSDGSFWNDRNQGLPSFASTFVSAIASKGTDVFVVPHTYGLYHSTDNGNNWSQVNSSLANYDIYALHFNGNNVFAGTGIAGANGVFISTDKGESWIIGLQGKHVYSFVSSGTNVFAGTDNGVYLSTNNGLIWNTVNEGIENKDVKALEISGTNLIAGTSGSSVYSRPISEMIPLISPSTSSLFFGIVPKNDSITQTFKLYSKTPLPLNISSILINSSRFKINKTAPVNLNGNDSLDFTITFKPTTYGDFVDTLTIISNGGTVRILLYGNCPQPNIVISNFSPRFGKVGSTVTISGNNFSSDPNNNMVYFGTVRADIISSSQTQIVVTIPPGPPISRISVYAFGLNCISSSDFITSSGLTYYDNASYINSMSFTTPNISLATDEAGYIPPIDIDGDGKLDFVTGDGFTNVTVYRNTSPGFPDTTISFASSQKITTAQYLSGIGDLNNDGLVDFITIQRINDIPFPLGLTVWKNTSIKGSIKLDSVASLPVPSFYIGDITRIRTGDINGDGKNDIIICYNINPGDGFNYLRYRIFLNTSTGSVLDKNSFSKYIDLDLPISSSGGVKIGNLQLQDFDSDGKMDLLFDVPSPLEQSALILVHNLTSGGTFSLNSLDKPIILAKGIDKSVVTDINNDGKADIIINGVTPNTGVLYVYYFLNNYTSGVLDSNSFIHSLKTNNLSVSGSSFDINGDGYIDFVNNGVIINVSENNQHIFRRDVSFNVRGFLVADFNLDGIAEFLSENGPNEPGGSQVIIKRGRRAVPFYARGIEYGAALKWEMYSGGDFKFYKVYHITYSSYVGGPILTSKIDTIYSRQDTARIYVEPGIFTLQVNVVNQQNQEIFYTSQKTVTPIGPFAVIKSIATGLNKATITWSQTGIDNFEWYKIYAGKALNDLHPIDSTNIRTDTSRTLNNLDGGNQYIFKVAVVDKDGFEIMPAEDIRGYIPASNAVYLSGVSSNTASAGDTVLIEGGNYSSDVNATVVNINGWHAKILSLGPNIIKAIVPSSASSGLITIASNGFVAKSNTPISIVPRRKLKTIFTANSYVLSAQLPFTPYWSGADGIIVLDYNDDGKPDLVFWRADTLWVMKNDIQNGIISSSSFNLAFSLSRPDGGYFTYSQDIDNDGYSELIVEVNSGSKRAVYKSIKDSINNNNFSFSKLAEFNPKGDDYHYFNPGRRNQFHDINKDGKLDLYDGEITFGQSLNDLNAAVSSAPANGVNNESFVNQVKLFSVPVYTMVHFADLSASNSAEAIELSTKNSPNYHFTIHKNFANNLHIDTSAFITRIDFPSINKQDFLDVRDLDLDGKPEILLQGIGSNFLNQTTILVNNIVNGDLNVNSFNQQIGISGTFYGIADIDRDGKPDLILDGIDPRINDHVNTIYFNHSEKGNLNASSYSSPFYLSKSLNKGVIKEIIDLDGDGKPEIITRDNSYIYIFKNTSYNLESPKIISAVPLIQSAKLQWFSSSLKNIVGYKIYRGNSSDSLSVIDSVLNGVNDTVKTITKLIGGKQYYFAVSVLDSLRNESYPSDAIAVTPENSTILNRSLVDYGPVQIGKTKIDSIVVKFGSLVDLQKPLKKEKIKFKNKIPDEAVDIVESPSMFIDKLSFDSIYTTTKWFLSNVSKALVPSGDSLKIYISFTPDSIRNYSDTLYLVNNSLSPLITVLLSGNSPNPSLTVSNSSINFGDIRVDTVQSRSIAISNSSVNSLLIDSIYTSTSYYLVENELRNKIINYGDTIKVSITFKPDSLKSYFDTLFVVNNSPNFLRKILISGRSPKPVFGLQQTTIDYGNVVLTQTSKKQINIAHSSINSLRIDSVKLKSNVFTFSESTFPQYVKKDDTLKVEIAFKPDSIKTYNDSAIIYSNSSTPSVIITLKGVGEKLTGVSRYGDLIPKVYTLSQNYPNPFNPSTTIRYGLPLTSHVSLMIYNILGQQIADLINFEQSAGWYEITWNANVSSGLYFYRIDAVSSDDPNKRFTQLKKMLFLK